MTIDEAIIHAREVAKRNRYLYKSCPAEHDTREHITCGQCAEEHEQLAEWLEELKSLRSASELWEHNNNLAYKQGRDDVIDKFVERLEHKALHQKTLADSRYAIVSLGEIVGIAKQMKEGE